MLAALGFVEVLCFEKRRETWRLSDCLIELDELPYLGCFVEIEASRAEEVQRMQELLELGELEHIQKSYIALLIEYCQDRNIAKRQVIFS